MLKVKIGKGRVEISRGGGLSFTAQDELITVEFEESLPGFSLQIGKSAETEAETYQSSETRTPTPVRKRKKSKKSVADYIEQVLVEQDRPVTMVDIVELITETGYKSSSKHWKNTVRSQAYRYKPDRFVQYDESTWGLASLNDKWRSEGKLKDFGDNQEAQPSSKVDLDEARTALREVVSNS